MAGIRMQEQDSDWLMVEEMKITSKIGVSTWASIMERKYEIRPLKEMLEVSLKSQIENALYSRCETLQSPKKNQIDEEKRRSWR
jgi:hypothetical protein